MDLGDIVIYGGQRYYVRGVDPVGAYPRHVYLENARTGETLSVAFERERSASEGPGVGLRLVRDDTGRTSTGGDPE